MASTGLVKFGAYEDDAVEEEKKAQSEGGTFLELKAGKTILRVLPPMLGKKSPFFRYHQHFLRGTGPDKETLSFACPRHCARLACPACSRADELKASGSPADFQKAKQFFAKKRVLANVIDRRNPDAGPKIWGFGKMVDDLLVDIRADGTDYTHPLKGHDIIVEKKGEGLNTEYGVRVVTNATPLHEDVAVMNEWLSNMHTLESECRVDTPHELAKNMAEFYGVPLERVLKAMNLEPEEEAKPARRRAQDDVDEDPYA